MALAFPALSAAVTAPIAIGTGQDDLAGIAVDAAGTAYIAWEDSSTSTPFLHYCKLPAGATTCTVSYSSGGQAGGLNPPQNSNCAGLLGSPSVILEGSDVLVFAYDNCSGIDNGEAGWVSTDGGNTFTNEPPGQTMSFTPPNNDSTTTKPVLALGNGLVGVGYVVPLGSPQFQAVQYDPFTSTFQQNYNGNTGPFATLDPGNTYAAGNLGGEFAAIPVGAPNAGVMGAISAFPNAPQNPCHNGTPFTAWAFAPLTASTTQTALNTNPGAAGSAWTQPLTPLDCNTEDPAVASGPAGFGILDGAFSGGGTFYHRFDAGTGRFGASETISTDQEQSPALSQDAAGGVYATWGASLTELRLAYSPDGGATWDGPVTLSDSSATGNRLGDPASSVNGAGAGWVTYHVGSTEYALPFSRVSAIVPPTTSGSGVSNGKTVTVSITCGTPPCTFTITITATTTTVTSSATDARTKKRHTKTITVASGTFTLRKKGANKVAVRLTGPGKGLLAKGHGHLKGSIVTGVKVAGVTVKSAPHGFRITTSKGKKH